MITIDTHFDEVKVACFSSIKQLNVDIRSPHRLYI